MALTNEEILDAIASKTVLEISELIKMMEEKFGVSAAAAAVAVAGPAAAAAAPAEEKTEFDVALRRPSRKASRRLTPKPLPRSSKKLAPRSSSSNNYCLTGKLRTDTSPLGAPVAEHLKASARRL